MPYETIFITTLLRFGKDVPLKNRYARTEVATRVRSIRGDEVEAAYSVAMPDPHYRRMGFDVASFEGKLWRPVLGNWTSEQGHPADEKAIEMLSSTAMDNPFGRFAIAGVSRIETAGLPIRNDDTPERRAAEAALMAISDSDVILVDGIAHRRCHEPTWIVRPIDGWQKYVLVQADVQSPGRMHDAVWFGAERIDDAMAFADQLAAERGWEVLGPRGEIETAGVLRPEFDDRARAEARLEDIWSARNIGLAGLDRLDELAEAVEARLSASPGSAEAAAAAEVLCDLVAAADLSNPEMRTMLSRSELPGSHLSFLRRRAILRRSDDDVLSALLGQEPYRG